MLNETKAQRQARLARNAASLNRPDTHRFGAYNKREKGPDGRYLVDTLGRDNTNKRGVEKNA